MSHPPTTAHAEPPQPLLRADSDGIARLVLNRPDQRNPLSETLMAALQGELGSIASDRSIRAVIIAATGPAFCAGHDLKELNDYRTDRDGGRAAFTRVLGRCSALMLAVTRLPQPVIAAVEGVATAAGCQLVATCDLAVAGARARFCTPGVHIGLFCSTPMVALSRSMGRKAAMEMLLLGEMIEAERAAQWGLVNRVVPAGKALDEAETMARAIATRSPATVAIGKRAFQEQMELTMEQAYAHACAVMVENMLHHDAEEGISAFLDKRPAHWRG